MQSFFRTLTVALVVGVFAVPRGSSAQTNAGWEAGKWKLNVAKSTSNCGPGPQSVKGQRCTSARVFEKQ
jgi:hypothetical protein